MSLITTIIIACLTFVAGILVGAGILQLAGKPQRKSRELEKNIQEKQSEIAQYRDEVQQHFSQTSQLLGELANNYREIHNHLANGAENLCEKEPNQPIIKPLPELFVQEGGDDAKPALPDSVEPPLDYAPKTSSDEKGALSEDFGLEKVSVNGENEAENQDNSKPPQQ